jgi:hypothetical protein
VTSHRWSRSFIEKKRKRRRNFCNFVKKKDEKMRNKNSQQNSNITESHSHEYSSSREYSQKSVAAVFESLKFLLNDCGFGAGRRISHARNVWWVRWLLVVGLDGRLLLRQHLINRLLLWHHIVVISLSTPKCVSIDANNQDERHGKNL